MALPSPALRPAWTLLDPDRGPLVPSGWPELDPVLGGGLPRDDLVEVLSEREGEGALTFALACAERLARAVDGDRVHRGARAVVLVDAPNATRDRGELLLLPTRAWPAGAVRVRARTVSEVLSLLERVLRCPAVGAAVGCLPGSARLDLAAGMRLRQAARAGGGTGILVRSGTLLPGRPGDRSGGPGRGRGASAAAVRLKVTRAACPAPDPTVEDGAQHEALTIEVLRVRGWPGAGAIASVRV